MPGRGPRPNDRELFAGERVPTLTRAVADLSWLLSRGYADPSALKLVGDRYALTARQRMAVSRAACGDAARHARRARRVDDVSGEIVLVDGFNALIVLESALSGGLVLVGRDGAHRDLASVHGAWRRVARTEDAISAMATALVPAREIQIFLDSPVSNSGRLARAMRELAATNAWPWRVELVPDPDRALAASGDVVATGDARVLDAGVRWFDLPAAAIAAFSEPAWVIDLSAA